MRPYLTCVILPVLFLSACKKERLSKDELLAYVQDRDNGLVQEVKVHDYLITSTYRPTDLLIEQEIEGEDSINLEALKSLDSVYSRNVYFVVSLSRAGQRVLRADSPQYNSLLQVLSFQMGEYVQIITSNNDIVPVLDYYFLNTYNLTSSNELLFVFSRDKLKGSSSLNLHVKEFGLDVGSLKFHYDLSDLDKTPSLNFIKEQ